ncbi:hypothetical protein ACMXYV_08100 [Neptuniibacter sp. SY11_33]|uniref:hypothetical protein n=1 Tax=Neptuniibacter sp. SY11_33 TaxID=3398215 RepID=UPI0039F56432
MNNYSDSFFLVLEKQVEAGSHFVSDDENLQFRTNRTAKLKVLDAINMVRNDYVNQSINKERYEFLFDKLLKIITKNTGCAEDLEIFEEILDELFDKGLIDEKIYRKYIYESPAARWL